ncbi:integrase catalytic domain-containing protein [Trichonephila clavipes]|nr:integrase catalytic domain-containing protein [Trichonephila clavipes]
MFSDESRFSLQSDSRQTLIWRAPGTCYHQENTIERHLCRNIDHARALNTHMSDLCENLCVQKKRAKLIQEGRCFICCNTGCYVKKCKKEVCTYCKGRHSRAICFKLEKSKQNSHLDLEKKNVDVKTTSSNSVFHNRSGVLLQCVKAEIIGRSSSDKIFCLFDNGSSDIYWFLTHRIKRLDSSLVAVETRLGWSLQGKCDERSDCTLVHLVHSEEESISTELRRFWEIESLGILDKGSVTLGNGDEEILSEFDKSVNFVDGRYRVNLPWKPGMREALQNNKTVARKRFEGLVRRFKCDHELFCEYKDVIDDYVREGIVERTCCDSLLDSQGFYPFKADFSSETNKSSTVPNLASTARVRALESVYLPNTASQITRYGQVRCPGAKSTSCSSTTRAVSYELVLAMLPKLTNSKSG